MQCGKLYYQHKDVLLAREFGKYESEIAKNIEYTVE